MAAQLNIAVLSLLVLFISIPKAQSTVVDVVANMHAKADGRTDISTVSKMHLRDIYKKEYYPIHR